MMRIKQSVHTALLLGFILLVAALLRFYQLGAVPSGLQKDEVSFLVNTMALKATGRDEDNRAHPLYLQSIIDPKPALISYLQIPSIALFGENTFAARFPVVMAGLLSLVTVFFFIKEVLDELYAFIVTGILAISPWHIVASRATYEVIFSFLFSVLTLHLFIRIVRSSHRSWWEVACGICAFILAVYLYHSTKIFLPSSLVLSYFIYRPQKEKFPSKKTIGFLLVSFCAVLFFTFFVKDATKRFASVGLFADPSPMIIANEQGTDATGKLPLLYMRAYYNKVVVYGKAFLENYLSYFDPRLYFFQIAQPVRYQIPLQGVLYIVELFLFFIGLIVALTRPKLRQKFLLFWGIFLIAPIPAALTTIEVPSMIRSFPIILSFAVCIATGLIWIVQLRPVWLKRLGLVVVSVGYAYCIVFFLGQFFVQQPSYQSWYRNVADEHMAALVKKYQSSYSSILVTTYYAEPYLYLVRSHAISVQQLQASYPARMQKQFSLANITFVPGECDVVPDYHTLMVTYSGCRFSYLYKIIDTASYDDGTPAYYFVIYSPPPDIRTPDKQAHKI
ncbi:hypothetical protein C5B42_04705 [Candidatus Cerribacteria bacterium 'Amazon FNV 2010 28 9']|uniref:Glycosyltransferase RgtA/B/C/D-like domain-containing protein n=1 Tax=Candidatus Cerribacteria bacterium 'Amazon FNV 2010 28 9' TaxID=2081795 RepID=A0A317JN10_9BACT|nr:MAG: hypothetical protein C5B42_04705 [Candidatus Cerribacteria bacterium 'Amazon FNV 2010 28 9']